MTSRTVTFIIMMLVVGIIARAEDWTTTDGKTYKGVTVLSHNDGFVTILDSDGGARIPLRLLKLNLQERFNYDLDKAAAFEAATAAQDKQDATALSAEAATTQQQKAAQVQAEATSEAATPSTAGVAVSAQDSEEINEEASELGDLQQQLSDINSQIADETRKGRIPGSAIQTAKSDLQNKVWAMQKHIHQLEGKTDSNQQAVAVTPTTPAPASSSPLAQPLQNRLASANARLAADKRRLAAHQADYLVDGPTMSAVDQANAQKVMENDQALIAHEQAEIDRIQQALASVQTASQ